MLVSAPAPSVAPNFIFLNAFHPGTVATRSQYSFLATRDGVGPLQLGQAEYLTQPQGTPRAAFPALAPTSPPFLLRPLPGENELSL